MTTPADPTTGAHWIHPAATEAEVEHLDHEQWELHRRFTPANPWALVGTARHPGQAQGMLNTEAGRRDLPGGTEFRLRTRQVTAWAVADVKHTRIPNFRVAQPTGKGTKWHGADSDHAAGTVVQALCGCRAEVTDTPFHRDAAAPMCASCATWLPFLPKPKATP